MANSISNTVKTNSDAHTRTKKEVSPRPPAAARAALKTRHERQKLMSIPRNLLKKINI